MGNTNYSEITSETLLSKHELLLDIVEKDDGLLITGESVNDLFHLLDFAKNKRHSFYIIFSDESYICLEWKPPGYKLNKNSISDEIPHRVPIKVSETSLDNSYCILYEPGKEGMKVQIYKYETWITYEQRFNRTWQSKNEIIQSLLLTPSSQ